MQQCVESGECGPSKQCVIAVAKGAMSKINSLLQKLSEDPKTTSRVIEPVQQASTPGMTPLKVVFVGLIRDGLVPILHTVS